MKHTPVAADLWSSAEWMLAQLRHIAGSAAAAAVSLLSRRERAQVMGWLAPLEAMVRKLLFIEAAALPAQQRAAAHRTAPRECAERVASSSPAFNLLPPNMRERPHPARIRSLGPPLLVRDIWRENLRRARIAALNGAPPASQGARMANRIVALARVIAAPLRHARRLARLLKRKAKASGIARAIAFASCRTVEPLFRVADFDEAGCRAAPLCDSS